MRISGNQNINVVGLSKEVVSNNNIFMRYDEGQHGNKTIEKSSTVGQTEQTQTPDNRNETKEKIQDAVTKMNEMLEVNNSTSKFMFHEGLERYYVTVVNRDTEEVVKEIPPKKLLDAFYEMQKMLGMVVDEKI